MISNILKRLCSFLQRKAYVSKPSKRRINTCISARNPRWGESGNVFFTLFGAVALVGVVGVATSTLMRGPLGTVVKLNQAAKADAQMQIAHRLAMLEAAQQANSGDCDSDGYVEPIGAKTVGCSPGPTGGGCLPDEIGTARNDPWGTNYGYCAWDHGTSVASGCAVNGANVLQGTNDSGEVVIAIISAGPDRTFQTTCANDPAYVTKPGGSDDMLLDITYAGAVEASGGLWSLKSGSPDTATIDKNVEVPEGNQVSFKSGGQFSGGDFGLSNAALSFGGDSLLLLPTDSTPGSLDGQCNAGNQGSLRRNTEGGTSSEVLEICDFAMTGDWANVATSGAGSGAQGNTGDIQFRSATEGAFDADPGVFNYNAGADTLSVPNAILSGNLQVDGNITDNNSDVTVDDGLVVTGTSDLQGDISDSAGELTVGDDFVVTGTSDLRGDIDNTTGDITINDNLIVTGTSNLQGDISDSTGDVTINDALVVTGDISDSNSDVTIADGLIVSGDISDSDSAVTFNDADGVDVILGDLSVTNGSTIADSFRLDGDGGLYDEGLYYLSAGNGLDFRTNGTTRMVVESSGEVGIGTSTPATLLDVAGVIKVSVDSTVCGPSTIGAIRYSSTTDELELCSDDSDGGGTDDWVTVGTSGGGGGGVGGVWTDETGYIRYKNLAYITNSGTDLSYSSALEGAGTRLLWYSSAAALRAGTVTGTEWDEGNVGQGSVAFGLDAMAKGDYSFAFGREARATQDYSVIFGLGDSSAPVPSVDAANSFGVFFGDQTNKVLSTPNTMGLFGGDLRLSSGNLQVYDGDIIVSDGTETAASGTLLLDVEGKVGATHYCDPTDAYCFTPQEVATGQLGAPGADSELIFNSGGALGTDADFVFLRSTGSLGIGTATPSSVLQVGEDNGATNNIITIGKSGVVESGINWQRMGGVDTRIFSDTSENLIFETDQQNTLADNLAKFQFRSNGGTNLLTILGTGNVGIGTATPVTNLDVDGTVKIAWDDTDACAGNAAMEGALRFDSAGNTFSFCADQANDWEVVNLGAGTLAALSDTTITAPADGELLYYSGGTWINNSLSADDITAPGADREIVFNSNGQFHAQAGFEYTDAGRLRLGYSSSNLYIDGGNETTTGENNTAVGLFTLNNNTSGNANTAMGRAAMYTNTSGYNNAAFGVNALYSNTTGYHNTAIGHSAGRWIADGSTANETSRNSVYIGRAAKALADGGFNEIVIGFDATGIGNNSVVLGNDFITKTLLKGSVGIGTTDPKSKVHVSGDLLLANSGTCTTADNKGALRLNATADRLEICGNADTWEAFTADAASGSNAIDDLSDALKETTNDNMFIAHEGGSFGVNNEKNLAVGIDALISLNNSAVQPWHGDWNTALGYGALSSNTTGFSNTASGTNALFSNTTGGSNTASGHAALYSNTAGSSNTAIGHNAGRYITDGSSPNQTTDQSVYIGSETKALADGATNEIVIGYDATGLGDNSVVLGNDSIATTLLKGDVGVNNATPQTTMDIVETGGVGGAVFVSNTDSTKTSGVKLFTTRPDMDKGAQVGSGNKLWQVNATGDGHATKPNRLNLNFWDSTGWVQGMNLFPDGNIIMGKTGIEIPQTKLEINGTLKIDWGGEACDASREGAIHYNSVDDRFYLCQTSGSWSTIATGNDSLWTNNGTYISYNSASAHLINDGESIPAGLATGGGMIWYKSAKAFRAGIATGSTWNNANIGDESTAFGKNTQASGIRSMAWGGSSYATGGYATAFGYNSIASGDHSIASGWTSTAAGHRSIAMGRDVITTGNHSIGLGHNVVVGDGVFSGGDPLLGSANPGTGYGSMAIGLIDSSNIPAVSPMVTGNQSFGIFMGDQSGYDLTDNNTMSLVGGKLLLDDDGTSPATRGCFRFDDASGKLQYSHNCSTYQTFGDASSVTAPGSDSQIIYNSGNQFYADANFVYTSAGHLGIGTAAPDEPFHVKDNGNMVLLEGTDHAYITFFPDLIAGGRKGWMGFGAAGNNHFSIVNQETDGDVRIRTQNTDRLTVDHLGNVGIALAGPRTRLDVDGTIKMAWDGEACDANREGAIHYNSSDNSFYVCKSAGSWDVLATGTPSLAIDDLTDAAKDTTNNNMFLGHEGGVAGANNDYNTAVGIGALDALDNDATVDAGDENTAFGYIALSANTTGSWNTAYGARALSFNTTGSYNTAFGRTALLSNLSGGNNVAIGGNAMAANTTGSSNVAIGKNALPDNLTGANNVVMGWRGMYTNVAKSRNTAIGSGAMYYADPEATPADTYNTALGYEALRGSGAPASNTGVHNTALGALALYGYTSGQHNTALGYQAGDSITTGSDNILIGYDVDLPAPTTNEYLNIGNLLYGDIGTTSTDPKIGAAKYCDENLANCFTAAGITGGGTTAHGADGYIQFNSGGVLHSNANFVYTAAGRLTLNSALNNVFVQGGNDTATGANNTGFGVSALTVNTSGYANTASGVSALASNTTGYQNVAVGMNAQEDATVAYENVAIGLSALRRNVAKSRNVAIGSKAMFYANDNATPSVTMNTAVGFSALIGSSTPADNTGIYNTAIGAQALRANTSGGNNTSVGLNSMYDNTTGSDNVAVGKTALYESVALNYNTAVGVDAMRNADDTTTPTDSYNTALGYRALYGSGTPANNTGTANVALGAEALYNNTSGYQNTAIGRASLYNNTTGFSNTATGHASLLSNTTGANNTAHGQNALYSNTTGVSNNAFGQSAMFENETGDYNVAMGGNALYNNTAKSRNIAIGYQAMYYADPEATPADTYNTAIGHQALRGSTTPANNTGTYNTAIGGNALLNNEDGSGNTAVGAGTLQNNTTGGNNTALGRWAITTNTTGVNNTGLGHLSLRYNDTGSNNVAVGQYTMEKTTQAGRNTAVGNNSLRYFATAAPNALAYNTAVGYNALLGVDGSTTGLRNTALGSLAGDSITTGSDNILIGYDVDLPAPTTNEYLNIGNLLYGDIGTTSTDPKIGAAKYCDETLTTCFTAASISGGGGGLWTAGSGNDIYYSSGTTPQVGIGTATPAYALDLKAVGQTYPLLGIAQNAASNNWTTNSWTRGIELGHGVALRFKGTDDPYYLMGAKTDKFYIGTAMVDDNSGPSSYHIVLDSAGRLGVGTTSPADDVDVSGIVKANSYKVVGAAGDAPVTSTVALDDLSDVTITSASNGECLTYNGSAWVDGSCGGGGGGGLWTAGTGDDIYYNSGTTPQVGIGLTDPDEALEVAGLVLADGFKAAGVAGDAPVTSTVALDDLSDVTITSASNGECLTYNGSAWVDGSCSGGAGVFEVTGGAGSELVRNNDSVAPYNTADFLFGSPTLDDDGLSAHDYRMYFDKSKAAFRAGYVTGSQWDSGSVGDFSAAMGQGTTASGANSTALGGFGIAAGDYSTALGYSTNASGNNSIAMGTSSVASGVGSFSAGVIATASGISSFALGTTNVASGASSTSIGTTTTASGYKSMAFGNKVTAGDGTAQAGDLGSNVGNYSVAFGLGNPGGTSPQVSGDESFAIFMGEQTGYDLTDSHKFALIGGEFVLDNDGSTAASKGCIRYSGTQLEYSDDCSSYSAFGSGGGGGLWTAGTGDIIYYSAGAPQVGIGTDSPASELEVVGVVQADGLQLDGVSGAAAPVSNLVDTLSDLSDVSAASPSNGEVLTYNGTSWIAQAAGAGSGLWTDNTTHISFQSAHFIKAGETMTSAGFDGPSTEGFFWHHDKNALRAGTSTGSTGWNESSTGTNSTAFGYRNTSSGSQSLTAGSANTASADNAIALGQSNTVSQAASFAGGYGNTVNGDRSVALGDSNAITGHWSYTMGYKNDADGGNMALGRFADVTGNGSIAIGASNADPATDPVVSGADSIGIFLGNQSGVNIADSNVFAIMGGEVGIDKASPDTTFHIYDNNTATGVTGAGLTLEQDGTGDVLAQFVLTGAQRWVLGTDNSDGDKFKLASDTDLNTNAVLTVDPAGYVGIGNTAPGVALDVTGDIEYTGTITDVSDRRLKTDIKPMDTAAMAEKLMQVDTYTFRMKDDEKGRIEYGVMAQELELLFPELVKTANDEMGTKSVNYVGLIAPLIETSKTLKSENDELRAQIAQIKTDRAALHDTLDDLRRDVNGLKAHTGYGVSKAEIGLWFLLGMLGGGALLFAASRLIGRRRA